MGVEKKELPTKAQKKHTKAQKVTKDMQKAREKSTQKDNSRKKCAETGRSREGRRNRAIFTRNALNGRVKSMAYQNYVTYDTCFFLTFGRRARFHGDFPYARAFSGRINGQRCSTTGAHVGALLIGYGLQFLPRGTHFRLTTG